MPILKEQIAKRVKGSLAENEDWWHLCYDTDANEFFVEHEWDHVNAYRVSEHSSDTERHAAEGWTGPGSGNLADARAKLLERARAHRT
jgi:hypothetical protein